MLLIQYRRIYGLPQYSNGSPFVQRRRIKVQRKHCSQAQIQVKAVLSRAQRIMEDIPETVEVGGAVGAYLYNALKRLDQLWSSICSAKAGHFDYLSKFSPVVKQIRRGKSADGVCLIVGSCCRGFKENIT